MEREVEPLLVEEMADFVIFYKRMQHTNCPHMSIIIITSHQIRVHLSRAKVAVMQERAGL